ncbi:YeeE/YedE family protein [Sulfurimonas sp. SAG-AH-194-L11]|nr:YeeE/YedE family protein [Sulfurimonas sp. SAG-AH-194-L11]MDF1876664.1 YeeE/YedE family protein [Sulfurimonas sp. SAG-AH-194-L11]
MFDFIDIEVYKIINILGLAIGISFGAIAQKNQFCFSGSIKDYFLTGSTKRGASVLMAMISAIFFTQILANYADIDLFYTHYYPQDINYFSIVLGGILFGVGMMIADGCSSRSIVKLAQGDLKTLVTLLFIAIFALATIKGFLSGFFNAFIHNETLIHISSYLENSALNLYVILFVLIVLLLKIVKKPSRIFALYDGFLIGLLVALSWLVTAIGMNESFERSIELSSISFVYPSAQTLELFTFYEKYELSFGVSIFLGVLLGAFMMSRVNRRYSFGCVSNIQKHSIKNNMLGGALMGIGGILTIGCTVGQGLSGISTLAFSSFLSISSILISGFFTAKYLNSKDLLPSCFIFEWKD